jgi:hypothetical protein
MTIFWSSERGFLLDMRGETPPAPPPSPAPAAYVLTAHSDPGLPQQVCEQILALIEEIRTTPLSADTVERFEEWVVGWNAQSFSSTEAAAFVLAQLDFQIISPCLEQRQRVEETGSWVRWQQICHWAISALIPGEPVEEILATYLRRQQFARPF